MKPVRVLIRQPQPTFNRAGSAVLRGAAVLLIVCGIALPPAAQAKHHSHPNAYHVIKAVNETAQTVTFGTENSKDHSEKALQISKFTEITVDGLKATLHDLQPGMMVQVEEDADNVATAINARHHNDK